MQKILKT